MQHPEVRNTFTRVKSIVSARPFYMPPTTGANRLGKIPALKTKNAKDCNEVVWHASSMFTQHCGGITAPLLFRNWSSSEIRRCPPPSAH